MEQKKIDRINELYKKSKHYGLTDDEKKEQENLRREYINDIKSDLKQKLNSITSVNNKDNSNKKQ